VINAGELVTCGEEAEDGLGLIEDGALTVEHGRVSWVGSTREFRRKSFGRPGRTIDAGGGLVTPGFVDPHTHLAFAGSREDELERKIRGESYISILKEGGGIARTVSDTRRASKARIVKESGGRMKQLVRNGVTTVEVKTGYGQTLKDEMKIVEAAAELGAAGGAEVVCTFLGLHASPPELSGSRAYVGYAIREMLPRIAAMENAPRFSDCFCEEGVFSREECLRYLKASARLGFGLKIHADEFSDMGGASLAAELACTSADHLGRSGREGIAAMARRGVVAVLLPGTSLYSGIPYADAEMIRDCGCKMALGTDLSPNSWIESPQLVMSLACNALKITPAEALLGFTKNAARALGRDDIGALRVGSSADFVVHSVGSYRFLPYRVGGAYASAVFKRGRQIFGAAAD
jgi:imidazolonepropionase